MGLPKTILVATDFSASAKHAQREAVLLAQQLGAQLHVMHAWKTPPMTASDSDWVFPEDIIAKVAASEHAAFEAALNEARGTLPNTGGKFVQGDPRDWILQVAKELHADLIVLGTHRRQGVSRFLLGSVAEYVVRNAACAVLVTRAPEPAA